MENNSRDIQHVAIIIADGSQLMRAGIGNTLEQYGDFSVVGQASSGAEAEEVLQKYLPDVLIIDWNLPTDNGEGGLEFAQRIKRQLPGLGVLLISSEVTDEKLFQALKAGVADLIGKDVEPDEFIQTLRSIAAGQYLINDRVLSSAPLASRVLEEFRTFSTTGNEQAALFAPITTREKEILEIIAAEGLSNKAVAKKLGISEQTVKNHMSSILRKLAVNDRTQAVLYALRQGWIVLDEEPKG